MSVVTYFVYYDGTGVNINGSNCLYDSTTNQCYTNTLVYDGIGVKPFSEATPLNGTCTGGTFLVYDGTGLKPTSYTSATCVAVAKAVAGVADGVRGCRG